jgi:hypothetical protein
MSRTRHTPETTQLRARTRWLKSVTPSGSSTRVHSSSIWVIVEVGQQADAVAEEGGDEVDVDLVEQAGSEVLLGHVGGADRDRPLTG